MEYAAPLLVGLYKMDARKFESLQTRCHKLFADRVVKDDAFSSRQRLNMMATRCIVSQPTMTITIRTSHVRYTPAVSAFRKLSSFSLKLTLQINDTFR